MDRPIANVGSGSRVISGPRVDIGSCPIATITAPSFPVICSKAIEALPRRSISLSSASLWCRGGHSRVLQDLIRSVLCPLWAQSRHNRFLSVATFRASKRHLAGNLNGSNACSMPGRTSIGRARFSPIKSGAGRLNSHPPPANARAAQVALTSASMVSRSNWSRPLPSRFSFLRSLRCARLATCGP